MHSDDISNRGDDLFEEMVLKDNSIYQPYIEDVNKRIKLQLTPVRSDGCQGPTYQHVIEPLTLPYRLQVSTVPPSVSLLSLDSLFSHGLHDANVDI